MCLCVCVKYREKGGRDKLCSTEHKHIWLKFCHKLYVCVCMFVGVSALIYVHVCMCLCVGDILF